MSGQTINLDKSSCMVSRNVNKGAAMALSRILGIKIADSLGDYLGLPSQSGRKKNKVFWKVKDRVWKAL